MIVAGVRCESQVATQLQFHQLCVEATKEKVVANESFIVIVSKSFQIKSFWQT